MTNEKKAKEIAGCASCFCKQWCKSTSDEDCCDEFENIIIMAKWKDKQMMELLNVARNVYEAWMGGTMNDVRECMKDLGHQIDTFLEISKEE